MELFNESVQRIKSNLSLYDEMIAYKHSRIYRKQCNITYNPIARLRMNFTNLVHVEVVCSTTKIRYARQTILDLKHISVFKV